MYIELFDMDKPFSTQDVDHNKDIEDISHLWKLVGDYQDRALRYGRAEELRALMSGLDYLVLRPSRKKQIVGTVSIMNCTPNQSKLELAKIDSLAVHPDYQGKSTRNGSKLAQAAVELCWQKGYREITVIAMPSSQGIFQRLGFESFEAYDSGNVSMFLDNGEVQPCSIAK